MLLDRNHMDRILNEDAVLWKRAAVPWPSASAPVGPCMHGNSHKSTVGSGRCYCMDNSTVLWPTHKSVNFNNVLGVN